MSRAVMVSLCFMLCLLVGSARSDELKDKVAAFVTQLESDQLKERDAAEKGLIALGPSALAALPKEDEKLPAEVGVRFEHVRKALEEQQIASIAAGSRVSLRGSMKLSEALASLTKQSGNEITDSRRQMGAAVDDPTLKLDIDQVGFWEALDKVLDEAQLATYDFGGEHAVMIVDRPKGQVDRQTMVDYHGPFRVQPTRVEAVRDLRDPKAAALRVSLLVSWEPKLRPIAVTQALDTVHATGTGDHELVVEGANTSPETPVADNASAADLQIGLELPPRDITQIIKLKGKFTVLALGPVEVFRFDKLPTGKGAAKFEQKRAGVRVSLDSVRRNQGLWEASVRVKFEKPEESLESHRGWVFDNEAYFVGPDNKRIRAGGYEQFLQEADEVGVKYLFDLEQGTDGLAFVYETPTAVMKLPVEFELHDLDLP